jgi:hemerythrin
MVDHFRNYVVKMKPNRSSNEIKKMFSFLQNYTQEHFKTEEDLMETMDYPLKSDHKEAHSEFTENFVNIVNAHKKDKNVGKLQEEVAKMLVWFLNHIREKDIRTGFYLKVKASSIVHKNQVQVYGNSAELNAGIKKELESLGLSKVICSDDQQESLQSLQTGDIAMLVIAEKGSLLKGVELLSRIRNNNDDSPVLLLPSKKNHKDLLVSIKQQSLKHPRNLILPAPYAIEDLIHKVNAAIF